MKTKLPPLRRWLGFLPLLSLAAYLLVFPAAVHAQNYQVTDLGTLGSTTSYANGINESGTVVGASSLSTDPVSRVRATRFGGTGANSGNLDLDPADSIASGANAINASGVIAGYSLKTATNFRATQFSGTGNVYLGTLGGISGFARAINASGVVVGESENLSFIATRYSGTGTGNTELGTLGGDRSYARGINASGVIVGEADTTNNTATRATRFSGTGTGNTDLGTLGGPLSAATAINDAGVTVGWANLPDDLNSRATRFSGTGTGNTNLGTLGGNNSEASAINNSGVIVGSADTIAGEGHAFVYRKGTMIDLNSLIPAGSGIVLTDARGINDAGQIAANGTTLQGYTRAFRLDPVSVPPLPSYQISVSASPSRKGTATGGGTFKKGKSITVTARPKKGKSFVQWTEKGKQISLKKNYTFTVTKSRDLVANFR